ncbi:MAG: Na+/H+ antiporter subunit E [Candidatus Competibacteraceae bacterium]|nr:Na+/H+ antiporter subunit E [Candidatus Competibacteraceae bacterium]
MKRLFVYLLRLPGFLAFGLYFLWEVLVANLRVAHDVLTPRPRFQPRIIALPLEAKSDLEILLLANLISLTPGTLTLDISRDERIMYLHASYAADPDALIARIREGLESRLIRLLRID